MQNNVEELMLLLLEEGSREHAVKLYQEETGATLLDAQQAVQAIALQHNLAGRSRSLLAALLLGATVLAGCLLWLP